MKAYKNLQLIGFLLFIFGLIGTLQGLISMSNSSILGPVFLAMGVIFAAAGTFRSKEYYNRNLYMIIVAVAIAALLIGEYIFAPAQNRLIFFIFTAVLAVSFVGMSYFILIPEESQTRKEKIGSWSALSLFAVAFYGLLAVIYNDFIKSLGLGLFVVVVFVISRLIHRKRALKA